MYAEALKPITDTMRKFPGVWDLPDAAGADKIKRLTIEVRTALNLTLPDEYVKKIDWLDEVSKEAIVEVAEGIERLVCFSCPCLYKLNDMLREPLECLDTQLRENEQLCFSVLNQYRRLLLDWERQYAPQAPEDVLDERFVEACHRLPWAEYQLDILLQGDSYERGEVVSELTANGYICKLQTRLREERYHE